MVYYFTRTEQERKERNMTENKDIIVDDSMVATCLGIKSYEEFSPFTGPFERTGVPYMDAEHERIENNSEEHKRFLWEHMRATIRDELLGLTDEPRYTQNGQVVYSRKEHKTVTLRDWFGLSEREVREIPSNPSSKIIYPFLTSNAVVHHIAVGPTGKWNGMINGRCIRTKVTRLNRFTRPIYMLQWVCKLVWAKMIGRTLVFPGWIKGQGTMKPYSNTFRSAMGYK